MPDYEYEVVRLGEGFLSARKAATKGYQDVIHEYAANGWRFVQAFAPGLGVYGGPKYYDLIFEREVQA